MQKGDLVVSPPNVWAEIKEQATLAYQSGLLPKSVDSAQKAVTIAMMGRELGLAPITALTNIYVVNGMASIKSALMLRLIYERVPGAKVEILTSVENADKECLVEMQRPGNKPQQFRYTLEDAKKGGFMSKPIWQQHTSTMLRWAAIRTGARIVFADAIAGCYMEDEVPHHAAVPIEVVSEPQLVAPTAAPEPKQLPLSVAPDGEWRPTPKQLDRLYAKVDAARWSEDAIKREMKDRFGVNHSRELNIKQYEILCKFVDDHPNTEEPEAATLDRYPFETGEEVQR